MQQLRTGELPTRWRALGPCGNPHALAWTTLLFELQLAHKVLQPACSDPGAGTEHEYGLTMLFSSFCAMQNVCFAYDVVPSACVSICAANTHFEISKRGVFRPSRRV